MKRNILTFSIVLTCFAVSCSKDICESQNDKFTQEIVSAESGQIICHSQDITKTELGSESEGLYPILWSTADEIEVYSQDGKSHSTYILKSKEASGAGVFTSDTPVEGSGRSSVYPASSFLGYAQDGSLRVDMSPLKDQKYSSKLSVDPVNICYCPLWAVEDPENAGHFNFNNLTGSIVLQLNDYQGLGLKITSVEIKSASRSLAGIVDVNPSDGSISFEESATKTSVKITNEAGLPICQSSPSLTTATEGFLIAIPAGTYPAGDLSFVFTDDQGRVYSKVVSVALTLKPGAVKKMAKLQFSLFYGTANCVIVNPGESATVNAEPYYSFSSVYAYENNRVKSESGENYAVDNATVSVLWELKAGAGAFASGSVLSACEYSDGKINVTAKNVKGNALVALKDEAGTILWSFHIWVTDTPAEHTYTNIRGGVFMDRNVGATSLTRSSKSSPVALDVHGLYFQHGRKDPFACSLSSWNTALSASEAISSSNGNIAYTIQHPDKRVINTVAKYHWCGYGDCYSFWGASKHCGTTAAAIKNFLETEGDCPKTVYDPCPAGYKVPEGNYLNFNLKDAAKATLSATGTDIKYDGTNLAYWPANGYLCHNTDVIDTKGSRRGTVVCNWTTSSNNGYSVRLFVTSTAYTLTTSDVQGRATAAGVRCRKITEPQGDPMTTTSQMEEPEDETL